MPGGSWLKVVRNKSIKARHFKREFYAIGEITSSSEFTVMVTTNIYKCLPYYMHAEWKECTIYKD